MSTSALPTCRFCGASPSHTTERCPEVKAVHYRRDGSIEKVEKLTPADRHWPIMITPAPRPEPLYWWQPGGSPTCVVGG